jgi:hypothetical protein
MPAMLLMESFYFLSGAKNVGQLIKPKPFYGLDCNPINLRIN